MTTPVTVRRSEAMGGRRRVRLVLAVAFGLVLLTVTLARVDLGSVVTVLAGAAVPGLAIAVVIVLVDLAIRGVRWQILLRGVPPAGRGSFRLAVAYLAIGYLANYLLPARLGDLARAYLAGTAFRLPRLSTLGTIMVERVADGGTMLGLAIVSSLLVVGITAVQTLAVTTAVLAGTGVAGLALGWLLVTRTSFGRTSVGRMARELSARLSAGMAATRTARGAVGVATSTLAAAGTAVLVGWSVAGAVGVELMAPEATLFMSAIALSLAVPAAPGSLGTYEFVGVVVLTSLGHTADRAFATMVLMRAVATIPPVVLGLVSTWVLHLRPAAILEQGEVDFPGGEETSPS